MNFLFLLLKQLRQNKKIKRKTKKSCHVNSSMLVPHLQFHQKTYKYNVLRKIFDCLATSNVTCCHILQRLERYTSQTWTLQRFFSKKYLYACANLSRYVNTIVWRLMMISFFNDHTPCLSHHKTMNYYLAQVNVKCNHKRKGHTQLQPTPQPRGR